MGCPSIARAPLSKARASSRSGVENPGVNCASSGSMSVRTCAPVHPLATAGPGRWPRAARSRGHTALAPRRWLLRSSLRLRCSAHPVPAGRRERSARRRASRTPCVRATRAARVRRKPDPGSTWPTAVQASAAMARSIEARNRVPVDSNRSTPAASREAQRGRGRAAHWPRPLNGEHAVVLLQRHAPDDCERLLGSARMRSGSRAMM